MIKAPGMRARPMAVAAAALTGLCASILAPMQPAAAASYVPISGAGSTWSYNAIHEWITDVAQFGMTVNYNDDGSSTGRSLFAQGTVDWAASEIPYGVQDGNNYDAPPSRGYAYMPDTAGGTTFMYNLMIGTQRVTNLRLSGKVIAGIFTDQITMWNDPQIAADNPGLTLPAIRIIPVVRSDGSGATADFTQWMLATEPSDWNAYCQVVGRNPCTQTSTYPIAPGTTAMVGQAGDLGVSGYVSQAQSDGAIGYVEFSYALETGFPVALVLNAAGYYTEPTAENVAVSLLQAQLNTNKGSADYLTAEPVGCLHRHRPAHLRAVVLLVHDPADRHVQRVDQRQGLYPWCVRQLPAVPGPAAGRPAGLLRAADQPGRGRLRAVAADPREPGGQRDLLLYPGLQQPHLLRQRHQHPGRQRPAAARLRQAGLDPVHHRHWRRSRRRQPGQRLDLQCQRQCQRQFQHQRQP